MNTAHGVSLALVLTASLGFTACAGKSHSADNLRNENAALAAQNQALEAQAAQAQEANDAAQQQLQAQAQTTLTADDLEAQIQKLQGDIAGKEAALADEQKQIDALKADASANDAEAAAKIQTLQDQITTDQASLIEQKNLVATLQLASDQKTADLAALFQASMAPYAGVWLLDPKPDLAFGTCNLMIRFDSEAGAIYRAAICDDGKIQAEVQSVSGFAANNSSGWNGTVGFAMQGVSKLSSCGTMASYIGSGTNYGFDHSVDTASAANEAALFLTSNIGSDAKTFKSGSSEPDLGKNKSCGVIITRAGLASQASNLLLQQAAKVCQLTADLKGTGCFTAKDRFTPTL